MTDDRNNQSGQSQAAPSGNEGGQQQANDQQKPGDRLNDGTNDFENGDQEEHSAQSTDPAEASRH